LDIIVDEEWGNLLDDNTKLYWLEQVRSRRVVAILSGPPCESWSKARFVADATLKNHGPQPLRSAHRPWGRLGVQARHNQQLSVSNALLLVALEFLVAAIQTGIMAILEHPAPSVDPTHPSIFRLPIVKVLVQVPCVQMLSFRQDIHGQVTRKQTNLLVVRLPNLRQMLRFPSLPQQIIDLYIQDRKDRAPVSHIGFDHKNNVFNTAMLKEYPIGMTHVFAKAIIQQVKQHRVLSFAEGNDAFTSADEESQFSEVLKKFQERFDPYDSSTYAELGADYSFFNK
jgi:hypothetical protein